MKMSNISSINKVIINIAKRLKKEDVDAIKFLYHDDIGEGVLEEAATALDLLKLLKQHGELDDLKKFCENILDEICRKDISDIVLSRTNENISSSSSNGNQSRKFVDILDLVANKITDDWKRLSRKLGHEEHTIRQIDLDYRQTYEKGYQSLVRWNRDNSSVAWDTLKAVLKELPRHDIVREVEKKFPVEENVRAMARTEQDLSEYKENSQLVYNKGTETLNKNLGKLDLK